MGRHTYDQTHIMPTVDNYLSVPREIRPHRASCVVKERIKLILFYAVTLLSVVSGLCIIVLACMVHLGLIVFTGKQAVFEVFLLMLPIIYLLTSVLLSLRRGR